MSDVESNDEERIGDKTKQSDFDKDLKKGPLNPANEDLFNFLDGLFFGEGEFPERIDVRTVKGRNKDQYRLQIFQRIFKSGSDKPSRERLVMLTNEIIHRCRVQTDSVQRECTYIVGAMHHGRSDDYFEVMSLTVMPSKRWKRGERGDLDGNGDEDDIPFHARYNIEQLGHQRQLFSLMGGFIEGLIDRSDRQAAAAMANADRAYARVIELLEANLRLVQADDERKERIEKSRMWRENVSKGLDMAWGLLPPMLGSLTSKGQHGGWQQGTETSESYTLREFFKTKDDGGRLAQHEFEKIFGKVENQQMLEPGILTMDQGQILARVATKEMNPDQLDELLPNGRCQITQEQVAAILGAGIPIEALAPLKMLLDVRMAKKQQKGE